MRKLLFFCLLLQLQPAFSQVKTPPPVVTSPQTFGYVDRIRLDSLNAEYAAFELGTEKLFFDYGQPQSRKKTTVTDEKGAPFLFVAQSIPFALNFLYFNGWELSQTYYNQYDKMGDFILKKRHDR